MSRILRVEITADEEAELKKRVYYGQVSQFLRLAVKIFLIDEDALKNLHKELTSGRSQSGKGRGTKQS